MRAHGSSSLSRFRSVAGIVGDDAPLHAERSQELLEQHLARMNHRAEHRGIARRLYFIRRRSFERRRPLPCRRSTSRILTISVEPPVPNTNVQRSRHIAAPIVDVPVAVHALPSTAIVPEPIILTLSTEFKV